MKKNYKIIAIIQARMKSRRLPNKSLIDLSGKPNILRMVDRVKLSKLINKTMYILFIAMILACYIS